jgi:hypothetical protein
MGLSWLAEINSDLYTHLLKNKTCKEGRLQNWREVEEGTDDKKFATDVRWSQNLVFQ